MTGYWSQRGRRARNPAGQDVRHPEKGRGKERRGKEREKKMDSEVKGWFVCGVRVRQSGAGWEGRVEW